MKIRRLVLLLLALLVLGPSLGVAELEAGPTVSAYVGKNHPMKVYWGDTHIHSGLSLDAGTWQSRSLVLVRRASLMLLVACAGVGCSLATT